ncbi:MAG TPA: SDR family NAD(P)-dependent oxidoreductase [Gammaproteobacteria bacterium]|nr:SDR family NAD(P)-dependent oxidoreductase [Gammaproteobacteria bacterium]
MKYLITGGSGFIGSSLAKSLLAAGHQVRVYDNDSRGCQARLDKISDNPNLEFIKGDIRNEDAVAIACQGVDSVLHLAYINGTEFFYEKPELILDVGVRGMLAVISGCREAGVRELVTMSSSEVYQDQRIPTDENVPLVVPDVHNPRYSYGGGKIISELMTINFGRNGFNRVMIIRPHNVYGPDMGKEHVIPQLTLRLTGMMHHPDNQEAIASNKPIDFLIQGNGMQTRSFVYIDDFVAGIMKILQYGKHLEIYHLGTTEEILIRNVALEIAATLNTKINLQFSKELWGSVQRRCPNIDKVRALGFAPTISIKEGIRHTSRWYYQNYAKLVNHKVNKNI